jgi:two-component system response regulator LytT
MKILIVEDEEMAMKKLQKTLLSVEHTADIVGMAGSIQEAVEWLETHQAPDLILMDIQLADGKSFEIFERTDVKSTVIFTTAFDEYAMKAFKVNSIDYLLKPVQKDELKAALDKFRRVKSLYGSSGGETLRKVENLVKELQQQIQPREYRQRFLVKQGQKLISMETQQIAYFFVDGGLTFFTSLEGKKYVVDYKLDELEAMLDPGRFFRISRSFCIAVTSVDQIRDYFGSRLILQLKPVIDKEVLVSREKVSEFKKWMGK